MFASLMSKQKAAKNAAVLELSCVQHKLCQSMSFAAPLWGQQEQRGPLGPLKGGFVPSAQFK